MFNAHGNLINDLSRRSIGFNFLIKDISGTNKMLKLGKESGTSRTVRRHVARPQRSDEQPHAVQIIYLQINSSFRLLCSQNDFFKSKKRKTKYEN